MCLLGFCSLGNGQQDVITEIVVHGNRRIPAETVRARVFSRPGDVFDPAAIERDFNSLWNTGYFEDIRFEREQTPKGWRIHIYVKERPTIREINYTGLSSVSTSDVLDRFKERKVGLTPESQYDPTKVKKAEVTQRIALRAWTAVCDGPYRGSSDSSRGSQPYICGERRAEGQGGQYPL